MNEIGVGLGGSAIEEGMTVSLCSDTMLAKDDVWSYSIEVSLLRYKYKFMGVHGCAWEKVVTIHECNELHSVTDCWKLS